MNRLQMAAKAAAQLGLKKTALYALYQLGVKSGCLRLLTRTSSTPPLTEWLQPARQLPLFLPAAGALEEVVGDTRAALLTEAATITAGYFHRFGTAETFPIQFAPSRPLRHWTDTTDQPSSGEDIKFIWEAARFGWVFPLGRAYTLQPDDSYAAAFWQQAETFWEHNPPNQGPNWASGQEVALRILAFSFAAQVFAGAPSSTSSRLHRLWSSIAEHARRIPPTLIYARAQNNNHLITEAVGLYTAGCLLPSHPQSARWRKLGWRWFQHAILNQIAEDGSYIQQSTNYHRLMLQAALWLDALARNQAQALPAAVHQRLGAATRWLCAMIDPLSGSVPNLGHNDGAHILPLASGTFSDYRPTAQAAARAFLDRPAFQNGPWDEVVLWLGLPLTPAPSPHRFSSSSVLRIDQEESWACLRAARFHDRPAQADQLHVDLWWQGLNIARDPGTFRYTAPAPWNNALARTAPHNTVLVDEQDQMTRAGRFLWLDWAQAHVLPQDDSPVSITAEHDGYRKLGVVHRRRLTPLPANGWLVKDVLLAATARRGNAPHKVALHWLLPDLPWHWQDNCLMLETPVGEVQLQITLSALPTHSPTTTPLFQIIRAGEVILGPAADLPTLGWFSPTYAYKQPALSLRTTCDGVLPLELTSVWGLTPNP